MTDFCYYCQMRIFTPLERSYPTCDFCQTVSCKKCFASGILPIIYWKRSNIENIRKYCSNCYLNPNKRQ